MSVLDVVGQILAARGPLTDEQLFPELAELGIDLGEHAADILADELEQLPDSQVVLLADDRWAWLPTLLAGRVLAHRLTDPEVAHDLLFLVPDLTSASLLIETDEAHLADGTAIELVILPLETDKLVERGVDLHQIFDYEVVLLPQGYWAGQNLQSGDLVALRIGEQGLALEVPAAPADPKAITAVAEALNAVLEQNEPEQVEAAILTACAADPELFREPLLPLDELFAASGLTRTVDMLARDGFDFDGWESDTHHAGLMERYELDEVEARAVQAGITLYEQVLDEVPLDPTAIAALSPLSEPFVAMALLEQTTSYDRLLAEPLGEFAEKLEPLLAKNTWPALRWLRARSHELLGEVAAAEQVLLESEALDSEWPLTVSALARYSFDRGNTTRGLSLLRRIGVPDDEPIVQAFERYDAAPRTDIGRNDECWCGSGKKFKKCHLTGGGLSPEERALWLYEKTSRYQMDSPRHLLHDNLSDVRAQYAETEEEIFDAVTDPLVMDALLFEGGGFAEFLDIRGVLLPEDEQALAKQWVATKRSVHEVTAIEPGEHLTLHDLRSGETVQARERIASTEVAIGDLVCARISLTGDEPGILGGIELVAPEQRDELITLLDSGPTPTELVEFLTRP
ncbi:hypothetical protein E1263_00875 [Kribbella antibiotica]|uniref:SEC-C domain-containing protein n=1 Tax=Kribbella antibiotica TaxID=190195 RepID=A0A4R4ZWB6_9ACTN|nr:SEC-C domain-containing protein [Kribbella antibiotica]TDD63215.1 hypothetical protein E1263_00875 [Kribbella antibiotica]